MKFLLILLVQASACASLLGLYLSIYPATELRPWWHWLLIFLGVAGTTSLIIRETIDTIRNSPKKFRKQTDINRYMRNWLSSGGRAVVFSRDMSWVDDEETRAILFKKAEAGELTLCVEHEMKLAQELRQAGARITVYGEFNHVPRSRFTIVDFEKEGARVAVGAAIKGGHIIQEYRNGEHPFFGLAEDMAKLLIALNARNP